MNVRAKTATLATGMIVLVVFALGAKTARASGLVKVPNNLGLVGYWSLEDGAGTKATDFSGNGNTGTLTNGPLWVGGKRGKAVSFDGSNDRIDITEVSGLPIYSKTNPYSISMWVKGGVGGTVFAEGNSGSANQFFTITPNGSTGKVAVSLDNDAGGAPLNFVQSTATAFDDTWHYLTWVDTAGTAKLYIDGVQDATNFNYTPGGGTFTFNNDTLGVQRGTSYHDFWTGSIDEVRIYNRALSATEVAALYSNTRKVTAKAVSNNNLLASWSFDDATGTLATDSSGKGNTGTLTNGPTWVQGKHNKALSFDGSDDYVVSANSAFITNTEQAHSVFAWVKTPANVDQVVWDYGEVNDSDCASSLQIRSNGHLVHDANGSSFTPTFAVDSNLIVPANQWTFVGFTHNAASGVTLYVNGQSFSGSSPGCGPVGFNPHLIGLGFQNTAPAGYFSGSIDDVLAYNRTLSAAEVATLYQSGSAKINASQNTKSTSGLIGLWSFNGQDVHGTVAYDRSGQGNNGTITGGPRAVPGKVGQGFEFSNSKSIVLSTSAFDLTSSSFTISAWFKTVSTGSNLGIYTKSGASSRIKLYQTGGSTLRFRLVNSSAVGVSIDTSGININDGAWHQVAATFDFSSAAGVVYIDGVSRGSGTGPSGDLDASPSVHLLGQGDGGNAESWNGSLDELRIYNRALTAAEVLQLYTQSK